MTSDEALSRLKAMTAWDTEPSLSSGELASLLLMCRLADSAGLPPTDPAWVPTYDLNRGAAEGWRWKAGKASSGVQVSISGDIAVSQQQVYEHCMAQSKAYGRRRVATLSVPGTLTTAT